MKKEYSVKQLFNAISHCSCAFTSTKYLKELLLDNNYQELVEFEPWEIKPGNYFVIRNDASIIAFQIPEKANSYHIITTHCDTPALLLKPDGENVYDNILKFNVMPYGGLLNYGWLDHPLSIAGRLIVQKNQEFQKIIMDYQDTFAVIPSIAIHQNDKANSNLDLNMQVDLQPIFSIGEKELKLENLIKDFIPQNTKLCDYDLFLYNNTPPTCFGAKKELLISPRIDNITSVIAAFQSFLEANNSNHINVFCSFNNEEIGSLTKEGAESSFLLDTLKHIASDLDLDITSTLASSFIISSDNTHANHPNHPELKDDTGTPSLGKGFCIVKEINSTTDAYFSSMLKYLCQKNKIKWQNMTAKNDLVGGSTLSGLTLRHVSVTSIDVGIAQLAMHSSMEVCSIDDFYSLYQIMKIFFQTDFKITKKSTKIISNLS